MVANGYSKLMSRRLGPYLVLSVEPENLQILQNGVENTEAINRVSF